MSVDPDFLMVPPSPMAWLPDIIGASYMVAGAANVVRSIANLDRYRSRISIIGAATVIRSRTIIRSVAWVGAIIPFAPCCSERGENQDQQESRPSQFNFCSTLWAHCFFVRRI